MYLSGIGTWTTQGTTSLIPAQCSHPPPLVTAPHRVCLRSPQVDGDLDAWTTTLKHLHAIPTSGAGPQHLHAVPPAASPRHLRPVPIARAVGPSAAVAPQQPRLSSSVSGDAGGGVPAVGSSPATEQQQRLLLLLQPELCRDCRESAIFRMLPILHKYDMQALLAECLQYLQTQLLPGALSPDPSSPCFILGWIGLFDALRLDEQKEVRLHACIRRRPERDAE